MMTKNKLEPKAFEMILSGDPSENSLTRWLGDGAHACWGFGEGYHASVKIH